MPNSSNLPIIFTPATDRKDGGRTENYRVYAGGGQMQVTNKRGEQILKNAVLGGNGTIYIANELAGTHDEWVLMPRAMYDQLAIETRRLRRTSEDQYFPTPSSSKAKGKKR